MKVLTAENGKVWAYRDDKGEEIVLGEVLYLGKNDNGERYYQIEKVVQDDQ